MSAPTIREYLAARGLEIYADTFEREAITPETLMLLKDEELRTLGVEAMGHRKLLLSALGEKPVTPPGQAQVEVSPPTAAHATGPLPLGGERPNPGRSSWGILLGVLMAATAWAPWFEMVSTGSYMGHSASASSGGISGFPSGEGLALIVCGVVVAILSHLGTRFRWIPGLFGALSVLELGARLRGTMPSISYSVAGASASAGLKILWGWWLALAITSMVALGASSWGSGPSASRRRLEPIHILAFLGFPLMPLPGALLMEALGRWRGGDPTEQGPLPERW